MKIRLQLVCAMVTCALLMACSSGNSGGSSGPSSSSSSSSSASSSTGFTGPIPDWFPTGVATALPQIHIGTTDNQPVVSRDTYVTGTFELHETDSITPAVSGDLEIRGRGNSSWDWPKKPYRVKLAEATELLGMPASRHWVLLANYADKTLIRNDVAFTLSRHMGFEYTVRDRHVEVYINGQYQGIYQLVEQIRLAKDRLDVPDLEVEDTDAETITGGYLIEVDFRMNTDLCLNPAFAHNSYCVNGVNTEREKTFCVESQHGMNPICLHEPEDLLTDEWQAQRNYIAQYLTDMEAALFGENFADPDTGYAAFIDVDSAVNYYLINELFKNADGGTASFYLYKKRGGKLFFGPIWDFDLALGNAGNIYMAAVVDPRGWHVREASWFSRLFADPAFAEKFKTRWNQLKEQGLFEQMFGYAQARAHWFSVKQADNFSRWRQVWRECAWFTRLVLGSYEAERQEMLRWQTERFEWMDGVINGTIDPAFTPDLTMCTMNTFSW